MVDSCDAIDAMDEEISFESSFATFEDLTVMMREAHLQLDDGQALIWLSLQGKSTAGGLSQALGISKPKATRVVRRLSEAGLIRESLDYDDLRKCNYRITNRGKNVVFEVGKRFDDVDAEDQLQVFIALRAAIGKANEKLAEEGVSWRIGDTEQRIVLIAYASADPLSVCDLARRASLAQSKTSMCLARLQKRDLLRIENESHGVGRRFVKLTAEGQGIAKGIIYALNAQFTS